MRRINFTKHTETFQEMARLGLAFDKPELAPVIFDDPVQGGRREYQSRVKALGYKFSWEAEEDDKFNVVVSTASSLGDSFRETQEIDASVIWNRAFAADSPTDDMLCFDGLSLVNTAHTRLDGGPSQANLFTGDISLALIQSFRYHFRNLRNDRGFRNQGHKLSVLMIAPDASSEPLLDQILGGIGIDHQPFTADRTPHELRSAPTMRKEVYSYLDDVDRTFALSNIALSKDDGPFWADRRMLSMTSWDDDEVQASCHAGSYRWSIGNPDWHGVAGSTGA